LRVAERYVASDEAAPTRDHSRSADRRKNPLCVGESLEPGLRRRSEHGLSGEDLEGGRSRAPAVRVGLRRRDAHSRRNHDAHEPRHRRAADHRAVRAGGLHDRQQLHRNTRKDAMDRHGAARLRDDARPGAPLGSPVRAQATRTDLTEGAMSTVPRYQIPVEPTRWQLRAESETTFTWDYDDGRERLVKLYDKAKHQQWDAARRIDWTINVDPENPMELPDTDLQIFGSPIWERLTTKERAKVRHHAQAHAISQFVHAEQGALIATARIV